MDAGVGGDGWRERGEFGGWCQEVECAVEDGTRYFF